MPHTTRMPGQTTPTSDGLNNPPYTTSVDVTLPPTADEPLPRHIQTYVPDHADLAEVDQET